LPIVYILKTSKPISASKLLMDIKKDLKLSKNFRFKVYRVLDAVVSRNFSQIREYSSSNKKLAKLSDGIPLCNCLKVKGFLLGCKKICHVSLDPGKFGLKDLFTDL
jgi:hypothetical protein